MFVHCFMDGRDTPPESGAGFIEQIEKKMREYRDRQDRFGCRAATTRWIATSAGSASNGLSARWCWETARSLPIRSTAVRSPTSAAHR